MRDFPVFDLPERKLPEFDVPSFRVPIFSATSATVRELLRTYLTFHPSLRPSTRLDYKCEVNKFLKWCGCELRVAELTDEMLASYLEQMLKTGPATTAKKSRTTLLALWRFAYRRRFCETFPRDVPLIQVPKRAPQAWTPAQIYRLLLACDSAEKLYQWDGRHWRALILTIYDTSLRIGALLKSPLTAVDLDRLTLRTAPEDQKQNAEQVHRLHPQTVQAISATLEGEREKLFPFPFAKCRIWAHFRKLLKIAELPTTRRDLFHKIRRTSYTLTYATLGGAAATDHAGHSADLSASYLDRELWRAVSNTPSPVDVMPRPGGPTLRLYDGQDQSVDAG